MKNKQGLLLGVFCVLLVVSQGCTGAGAASNRQGLEAYQSGSYTKAIGLFNQAITQDGTCAEYYVNRGMAECAAADYEAALDSFGEAIELDAGAADAYRGIGITYMYQKDYDRALEALDQALNCLHDQKTELSFDILGYRAMAKTLSGDYDGAAEDYEMLISYGYEQERIYMLLGDVYLKKNDVSSALIQYQNSININYKDIGKFLEIASALKDAGFEEERQMVLDTALSLEAETAENKYGRGLIYLERDQDKEAFSEFEQAYNMGYQAAGYYLGYCYELWEQYSEAELIYQKQLTVSPDDARIYNQLAVCMLKQEKYQEALLLIDQGLALADRTVADDLMWNRVVCYEKLHDFDRAIGALEEYLVQYPADSSGRQELSYLRSR